MIILILPFFRQLFARQNFYRTLYCRKWTSNKLWGEIFRRMICTLTRYNCMIKIWIINVRGPKQKVEQIELRIETNRVESRNE